MSLHMDGVALVLCDSFVIAVMRSYDDGLEY